MFPKDAKIVVTEVFNFKWRFSKFAKKSPNIWATLVSKFVSNYYEKSPNLATLIKSYGCMLSKWAIMSPIFRLGLIISCDLDPE